MFFKNKRIVNRELIEQMKNNPCEVCNAKPKSDVHHIKTVKSGGDDVPSNLVSLCRSHHSEAHATGIATFADRFPKFKARLLSNGWELTDGKWRLIK